MADNGTTQTNWPVPGGVAALGAGTMHIRVGRSERADMDADFAAVVLPLLAQQARVLYANNFGASTFIQSAGLTWDDHGGVFESIAADSLLTITAGLYRMWLTTDPSVPIVLVINDWIHASTDIREAHDDATANDWLYAALTADLELLGAITGLDFERYTKNPKPQKLTQPIVIIDGTMRSKALTRPAGPRITDVMGGPRFVDMAGTVVWVNSSRVENRMWLANATVLKAHTGNTVTIPITRDMVKDCWRPVS